MITTACRWGGSAYRAAGGEVTAIRRERDRRSRKRLSMENSVSRMGTPSAQGRQGQTDDGWTSSCHIRSMPR
jgi:hypothetical protein